MSLLVVDEAKIIQRILDVLQDNEKLTEDDDKTKVIRRFKFGEPDYGITDDVTPYCYVSIPQQFQFTRETTGSRLSQYDQQFVKFEIAVIIQHKTIEFVQKSFFFFVDEIVRTIKGNPTLLKPVSNDDPLVKRTLIVDVQRFKPQEGTEQDGIKIILQCQVGVLWTLTFSSLGPLALEGLSKPLETVGNISDTDLMEDGTIAESSMSDPGALDFEFESNDANDITIKTAIKAGAEIPASLVTPGGTRALIVFLTEIRKPTQQDIIEKSVLSMKIIT